MRNGLDRRELLMRGSAALFHLAISRPVRADDAIPLFGCQLPIPPVLRPVRRDSTADYYEIVQREA